MRYLFLFFTVLLAFVPHLIAQQKIIQEKLDELSRLGVQYKFLDGTTIELSDSLTGYKSIKTIKETSTKAIYSWAQSKDIPVIDFDPVQIDTNKWTGWYEYWTFTRVTNWFGGIPTKVGDFDKNGFPEVYGFFGYVGDTENRVYEVYPDGSTTQRYAFIPHPGGSTFITDVDSNGLEEIVFLRGQNSYFFEQTDTNTLPINPKFTFKKYDALGAYLTREKIANMDGDSLLDFVHRGSDTTSSPYYLMYVSEYNPTLNNFEKKWYLEPIIGPNIGFSDGYDAGDYDGDDKMEAISSSMFGKIRIIENIGNDSYAENFYDSLPLVNMYYQASGDVDRDGKREFFIGATMSDGNWTVMFEADGDNQYTPKVALHLLSGGSLDEPTYIADDINGDGKLELAILSGGYLYIFKSDGDNSYYLWYLKQGPSNMVVSFYDMNGDGTKDILWGLEWQENLISHIYKASELVSVKDEKYIIPDKFELFQNYPNPFNPSTTISYRCPVTGNVTLKVYDILGKEVAILVNEEKQAGSYTVKFDGSKLPSGVYIYKIQAGDFVSSKKMILLK